MKCSTEEEIESFSSKTQCKSVIIIMEDLKVKIVNQREGVRAGKFGLRTRKERRRKFIPWYTANDQVITNTWLQGHPRRLWTCRSPREETKKQN